MTLQIENLCSILEQHLLEGSELIHQKKEWVLYNKQGERVTSANSIYGILTTLYFNRATPSEKN